MAVLDENNSIPLARQALIAYGLPADAPLTFVKLRENCVFRVDTGQGSFALRLHRPGYRSVTEVATEVALVHHLAREGLPVPRVVSTADGQLHAAVRHDGVKVLVDLQHWVDSGGNLDSVEEAVRGTSALEPSTFARIGALAARLHDVAERREHPPAGHRTAWDAEGLVGKNSLWGDPRTLPGLRSGDVDLIDRAAGHVTATLARHDPGPSRYGFIHADLTPENLLRTGEDLVLIDFDDCGEGWYLFDLATVLFFYLPHPRAGEFRAALLAGYTASRPLTAQDLDLFEVLLLARGLTYLGWAATRCETATAAFLVEEVLPSVLDLARAQCPAGEAHPVP
ncbi:phosphotransferase enzyme family protein [Kineococcus sp. SYSU DK001]|uniref:phosphotransferase enzyme family protein n=1 Tax=Kineococcus sp. SYSU DK001 TaxID=3383122 RepID=UPI003D7D045C